MDKSGTFDPGSRPDAARPAGRPLPWTSPSRPPMLTQLQCKLIRDRCSEMMRAVLVAADADVAVDLL